MCTRESIDVSMNKKKYTWTGDIPPLSFIHVADNTMDLEGCSKFKVI